MVLGINPARDNKWEITVGARGPKSIIERSMTLPKRRVIKANLKPIPKAPKHLRRETQAWWNAVVLNYDLEDYALRTLLMACEIYDRRLQAREVLATKGLSYSDGKGQWRTRPEVQIERDCNAAFLRAVRSLKLDGPPPPDDMDLTPWLNGDE
jgi:phage terminase small subunit